MLYYYTIPRGIGSLVNRTRTSSINPIKANEFPLFKPELEGEYILEDILELLIVLVLVEVVTTS